MKCSKCGAPVTEDAKFCLECGAPVETPSAVKCPLCGGDNPPESRFCAVCGAKMYKAAETSSLPTPEYAAERAIPAEGGFSAQQSSAAAVKPIRKKRTALWVVLSVLAVLAICGVIIGLFFRGLFLNLILGNGRYASQLEAKSVLGAVDLIAPKDKELALTQEEISKLASDAIGDLAKSYRSANTMGEGIQEFDLGGVISLYNQKMKDTFGTNGAEIKFDLDAELTDSGKAMLGVSDEIADTIDEVLAAIGDISFAAEAAADEEKIQAYIAMTGGEAVYDVKVIARADGTIALLLPFATEKGVMIKLDIGEPLENLEVDVQLEKIKSIAIDLAMIYLRHYADAEVVIEKGSLEMAEVRCKGRLVQVEMTNEKVGEMAAEMIAYISEDEYLTSCILDIINYCGADYTAQMLKEKFDSAAESVKDNTNVSFKVNTVVDYNNNILGKSYAVTVGDSTLGAGYADTEDELGAALFNGNKDILTAVIDKTDDHSGKIHFGLSTGFGATIGFNLDYSDAKIVEFGTGKVMVGDLHLYLAGTKNSEESGSAIRLGIKCSVEDGAYKSSLYFKAAQYANVAFNASLTPRDVAITDIPENLLDITDISEWSLSDIDSLKYVLEMLNDIKNAAGFEGSPFEALLKPIADIAIKAIEDKLSEVVPYDKISALADILFGAKSDIEKIYAIAADFCPDNIIDKAEEVYDTITDCYEEISDKTEMIKETYDEYSEKVDEYVEDAKEICDTLTEAAENGIDAILPEQTVEATPEHIAAAQADGIIGTWKLKSVSVFGVSKSVEEIGENSFAINEDGTADISCLGISAKAVWTYEDNKLTIKEDTGVGELSSVFELDGENLVVKTKGVKRTYVKEPPEA
ncbi:MAG: zinc-ribbon domain-containing protein [Oscillospiraceae bacterium]